VGKGAYIGSGSTITRNVLPGALAITRAPEKHKPGWAKQRAELKKKEGSSGKKRK